MHAYVHPPVSMRSFVMQRLGGGAPLLPAGPRSPCDRPSDAAAGIAVIVQHAVRKLGFLRDLAQAGPRIAELGQGFQRSLGKFDSSCTELVDTSTLDSIRGPTRPPRRFNLPLRHSRFLAHAQNSESPRHLGSNNAQKRP